MLNAMKALLSKELTKLVDEYRARCLWYMRQDYYPKTDKEALTVLRAIERHGDAAAFKRAATLRQWLLQNSNATSAE